MTSNSCIPAKNLILRKELLELGIETADELLDVPYSYLKDVVRAIKKVMKEYPEIKGNLRYIGIADLDEEIIVCIQKNINCLKSGHSIVLNSKAWLNSSLRWTILCGYLTKFSACSTIEEIIFHEMGHILASINIHKHFNYQKNCCTNHFYFNEEEVSEFFKNIGIDKKYLFFISSYSTTNYNESYAELFSFVFSMKANKKAFRYLFYLPFKKKFDMILFEHPQKFYPVLT